MQKEVWNGVMAQTKKKLVDAAASRLNYNISSTMMSWISLAERKKKNNVKIINLVFISPVYLARQTLHGRAESLLQASDATEQFLFGCCLCL